MFLDKIALAVAIIGGLNWGSIGLFDFDLVAFISGGPGTWLARIVYTIVGLAALWCRHHKIHDAVRKELRLHQVLVRLIKPLFLSLFPAKSADDGQSG